MNATPAFAIPPAAEAATAPSAASKRWQTAGWVMLFWFGFYALMTPSDLIEDWQITHGANLPRDIFGHTVQALLWSAASPLMLWLSQHFAVLGPKRWRNVLLHALAGLSIGAAVDAICYLAIHLFFGDRIGAQVKWTLTASVVMSTPYLFVFYITFVAIVHAVALVRSQEEREKLLAQAQVQALKAQLNPHFLYNTLNAVSEYAYKDAATAERLIAMLSELLRLSFAGGDAAKVTLAEELGFVRRYLDIQQLLFGERLRVEYRIDPASLDAQVPNFVLQPLVENAIVHGVSRRAGAGRIEIGSRCGDGRLMLWVVDNGPGVSAPAARRHGIGLASTRARLRQLYGEGEHLQLVSPLDRSDDGPAGGGFRAELSLPGEMRA